MDFVKLKEAMASAGYFVDCLDDNGKFNRFKIDGSKGEPGYYKILMTDAGPIAVYGDFVSGKKFTWTDGNGSDQLSEADHKKRKEFLARQAAKIEREHAKGAMAANFFWNTGAEVKTHQYLISKGVENYGLKLCTIGQYENWLMVPGMNAAGEIQTISYIKGAGEKRFETGAAKKGAFFSIPGDTDNIVICEGYSTGASIHKETGHTVIVSFDAGNLSPVSKTIRELHPDADIIIAADNDQWKPEIGNTGVEAATDAAIEIGAKLAIPAFKDTSSKPTDFNDLASSEDGVAVADQLSAAKPVDKIMALKAECEKLIDKDPLERELDRNRLFEKYDVRKSAIDDYLSKKTKERLEQEVDSIVEDVKPSASAVIGAALLDQISAGLVKRVILLDGAADAISLWLVMSYCYDAFNILPILGVTSPTKRCGKTTLLEILHGLSNKALMASNLTAAAVFRTTEKYKPCLIIDEADTFLKDRNSEIGGILNSGHNRAGAYVIRLVGDDHEPAKFSTWCPKAIGMIGTLPETLEDRSITIQLRRKMSTESVIRVGVDFARRSLVTRAKFKRWVQDNFDAVKNAVVDVPKSGSDRCDDNWTPLFKIAAVIGGGWPERCKAAMAKLVNIKDGEAIGTKLLIDISDILKAHRSERIFSATLIERLLDLTESPWADLRGGRGLTTNGLGRLLKPFGVESKTMRIGEERYKGYSLDSFKDSFKRYIPDSPSVTPGQHNDFNGLEENQNVTSNINVTDKKLDNHLNLFDCHDVTDENTVRGGKNDFDKEKNKSWEIGEL